MSGLNDVLSTIDEIKNKSEGSKCRVEVIVKKTAEGFDVVSGKYIADMGKASKEEFINKPPEEKEKYQEEQVKADAQESASENTEE
jgi:hypothetical protein